MQNLPSQRAYGDTISIYDLKDQILTEKFSQNFIAMCTLPLTKEDCMTLLSAKSSGTEEKTHLDPSDLQAASSIPESPSSALDTKPGRRYPLTKADTMINIPSSSLGIDTDSNEGVLSSSPSTIPPLCSSESDSCFFQETEGIRRQPCVFQNGKNTQQQQETNCFAEENHPYQYFFKLPVDPNNSRIVSVSIKKSTILLITSDNSRQQGENSDSSKAFTPPKKLVQNEETKRKEILPDEKDSALLDIKACTLTEHVLQQAAKANAFTTTTTTTKCSMNSTTETCDGSRQQKQQGCHTRGVSASIRLPADANVQAASAQYDSAQGALLVSVPRTAPSFLELRCDCVHRGSY